MNEPVDGRERHGRSGEDLSPFPERPIGGDEDRPAFIPWADEFKENRGFRLIRADVSEIVKDPQMECGSPAKTFSRDTLS